MQDKFKATIRAKIGTMPGSLGKWGLSLIMGIAVTIATLVFAVRWDDSYSGELAMSAAQLKNGFVIQEVPAYVVRQARERMPVLLRSAGAVAGDRAEIVEVRNAQRQLVCRVIPGAAVGGASGDSVAAPLKVEFEIPLKKRNMYQRITNQ